MKTFYSGLILILYSLIAFSQSNSKIYREVPKSDYYLPLEALYPNYHLQSSASTQEVLASLTKLLPKANQSEFKLVHFTSNSTTKHYLFQQYIEHQLVYNSCVKVNIDQHNKIYSVYYALADATKKMVVISNTQIPIPDLINTYKKVWIEREDNLEEIILRTTKDTKNAVYQEALIQNNEIIFSIDLNSYLTAHDTIIHGYIHHPDPITEFNSKYGGALIDNEDNTNGLLDSKKSLVAVSAIDSLGIFYLKSPYCEIVEIDPPIKNPVHSLNDSFLFNRFDDGFEDFNAFYHINHFHEYIKNDLGFELVNYPIPCDVHAFNGMDNSMFTFSTTPPSLHLGEGGVDDAEDADVVIHEYCHAVSHDAAPFSNVGSERNALDEGFCDYLACSYSKSINPFRANWVFNWDGHNQFWDGRIVDENKLYPSDVTSNIYVTGGIWSSALWDIEMKLGREKGNKLAIQTMYDNAINMSLDQVAVNYLRADSILYGGIDYCSIVHTMILRGLLPASYQQSCDFSTISSTSESNFSIANSLEFAEGVGDLFIHVNDFSNDIAYQLFDIQGHLIQSNPIFQPNYILSGELLTPGMYSLVLRSGKEIKTIKLLKY